jgi:hypothetical protein
MASRNEVRPSDWDFLFGMGMPRSENHARDENKIAAVSAGEFRPAVTAAKLVTKNSWNYLVLKSSDLGFLTDVDVHAGGDLTEHLDGDRVVAESLDRLG